MIHEASGMVKTTLGLLGLDKYLVEGNDCNCIVERHTPTGYSKCFVLEVELGKEPTSIGAMGKGLRRFADDIMESTAVVEKMDGLELEIKELKDEIKKLKKYETYFKAQYLMNHGEDPNVVMGFLR